MNRIWWKIKVTGKQWLNVLNMSTLLSLVCPFQALLL